METYNCSQCLEAQFLTYSNLFLGLCWGNRLPLTGLVPGKDIITPSNKPPHAEFVSLFSLSGIIRSALASSHQGLRRKSIWVGTLASRQFNVPGRTCLLRARALLLPVPEAPMRSSSWDLHLHVIFSLWPSCPKSLTYPLTHCSSCLLLVIHTSCLILSPTKDKNPMKARFLFWSMAIFAAPRTASGVADTQCLLKERRRNCKKQSELGHEKCLWNFQCHQLGLAEAVLC